MIHNGGRQAIVLDQDESMFQRGGGDNVSASLFEALRDIHGNKRFVLNDEDRPPLKLGACHDLPLRRGKAHATGGRATFFDGWPPVSQVPVNPQRATSVMTG